MIQLARSPLTKMSPDPAANAASQSKEGLAPGTPPPRSPPRSNGHRRLSTGIEEDAVQSLMRLATPVKSPGPLHTSPRRYGGSSGTENTPAAGIKNQNGLASGGGAGGSVTAEMTPVSLFRKSRQQGELGQLQSPFQSPFRSFQFSPSCLFSPPGAGTLDIPLASGDTPGPVLNRDIWQQTTPESTPRSVRTGSTSGIHGIHGAVGGGGGGIGGARGPGNDATEDGSDGCVKRKGKALFTDKRGPQDHSRLGQGWCLGTPGRARDGIHHAHLGVADIPATPDRVTADGSHVLPPTPQLLAPTPPRPPRACGTLESTAGEGAAGILLGLRSPEGVSSFGGGDGGSIAHSLFASLDEGYEACRSIASRNGSADNENGDMASTSHGVMNGGSQGREKGRSWSGDCWAKGTDEAGGGEAGGAARREARAEEGEKDAPRALKLPQSRNSTTSKRYRRWASPASSLRNSHCKSSFKIEGMTLIRTGSCSSSGSERSRGSGEGGGGSSNGRKQAAGSERSNCRVRSRGQSIADEPLSPPPSAAVSPEVPPLAMSRSRSLPSSPAKPPTPASKESTAVSVSVGATEPPATAPRASTRAPRTERPRRTPTAAAAAAVVPARTTPSRSTRKSSSQTSGSTVSSSGASAVSRSSSDPQSSLNSPEATTTATSASLRRGRTTPRPQTPPVTTDASSGSIGAEALVKPEEPPAVPLANGEDSSSCINPEERQGPTTCNCKKSKCLKLYCECFQRRQYCTDCNCQECLNTPSTEDLRQSAIQSTIERNPAAFESKFEKRAGGKRSHNSGCNCKKSACLKKYCECFQAGVACASNCKCTNCKNFEGASGGRKRRAAEAALTATQPPRTPPRPSGRGQRGSVVAAAAAAAGGADGGGAVGAMGDPSFYGRFMEPVNETDSGGDNVQVQVGEEDEVEIDGKDKSPPLAKVLRANVALPDTTSSSVTSFNSTASSTNGIATSTTTAGSHGDGGGDAAAKSHVALASTRLGARSQGTSPAAAAVADHAVARSLLDMGGTPPQVKVKTEAADDTAGFKLSVATGDGEGELSGRKALSGRGAGLELAASNGVVSEAPATESEICVSGEGGSEAVGTGKRLGYPHEGTGVGMEALLNRARSEAREKQALLASPTGDVSRGNHSHAGQADAGQEKVGAGNGGLEATEEKTGGRCLTPSLPAASPLPGVATARADVVASTSSKPKLPGFGAMSGVGKGNVVSTSGTKAAALGVV